MVLSCGGVQRYGAKSRAGVHGSAMLKQQPRSVSAAAISSKVKRRYKTGGICMHACTVLKQESNKMLVSLLSAEVQRRPAIIAGKVYVGAALKQQLHNREGAFRSSHV